VEDIAIGEHGEEWSEEPGRAAGGYGDEDEDAPEKEKDTESDGDFFSGGDAAEIGEEKKEEIEENVFELPDGIDAGGSSLLDELREPGVVDVAAEIAGFDVWMPEDGNEEESGEEEDSEFHWMGRVYADGKRRRSVRVEEFKSEENAGEERLGWCHAPSTACRKKRGTPVGMTNCTGSRRARDCGWKHHGTEPEKAKARGKITQRRRVRRVKRRNTQDPGTDSVPGATSRELQREEEPRNRPEGRPLQKQYLEKAPQGRVVSGRIGRRLGA
jgi:hypothetical protein